MLRCNGASHSGVRAIDAGISFAAVRVTCIFGGNCLHLPDVMVPKSNILPVLLFFAWLIGAGCEKQEDTTLPTQQSQMESFLRDRHAPRLATYEEAVEAVQAGDCDRYADDGEYGVGGDHARKVGCAAGGGDDHLYAFFFGFFRIFGHHVRRSVGRHDADIDFYAEFPEYLDGAFELVEIGIASHDQSHLRLHVFSPLPMVSGFHPYTYHQRRKCQGIIRRTEG